MKGPRMSPMGDPTGPMPVLHRDLSTGNQLGMLIAVAQTMIGVLMNPEREAENIPGEHPLPGEAKVAAENTFIKTCGRIDTILDDKTRWSTEYQTRLEKLFEEQHRVSVQAIKQQQITSQAQQRAAEEVSSPHFRYKPTLYQLHDGSWVAFIGDLEHMENGLLGQGTNPAEALRAFDNVFSGAVPKHIQEWLTQREDDLEEGRPLKPYPIESNIENEHEQALDPGRTDGTENPS